MRKMIKMFITLAMILSFTTIDVSAATSSGLSFSSSTTTASGDGWSWNKDTLTLTLTEDLEISSSGDGIYFSCEATIDLQGYDLTITASNYGIYASGSLTIIGTGDLDVYSSSSDAIHGDETVSITCNKLTVMSDGGDGIEGEGSNVALNVSNDLDIVTTFSGNAAIRVENGTIDLEVGGSATLKAKSLCIYTTSSLTVKVIGDLSLTAENTTYGRGVYADGSVDLEVGGDLDIDAGKDGIYSFYGNIEIDITGDATISSNNYSVYAEQGKVDLNLDGTAVFTNTSGDAVYAGSDISLSGQGELTTDGYILANGTVSIGEELTVNALVSQNDGDSNKDTVYGDFVFTDNSYFKSDVDTLSFANGSTLTIASGVDADISAYNSVDFTNANIVLEQDATIEYGSYVEVVYYAVIDSFIVDDIYVGNDIVHHIEVSLVDDDSNVVTNEDITYGDITYTYSTSEDGTYTATVPTTAGTYYVKATVGGNVGQTYATESTSAIAVFEILSQTSDPSDDGDVDTDTDLDGDITTDGDDDVDVDGDVPDDGNVDTDENIDTPDTNEEVDTGDSNNVLLYTTLSATALALVLIDMKKRVRVS